MKNPKKPIFIAIFITFCLFTLGACSSKGSTKVAENEKAEAIYKRAKDNMNIGDFEAAIEVFEKLESRYPFSKYSLQAQLDLVYAYYKFGEKYAAIAQVDRFIRFNPTHPEVGYAIYMKGVVQQNDRKGLFDKWAKPKREDFDIASLKDAYNSFNELLQRFPNSRYAADAQQRMIFIRNTLAASEWQVADFYLGRHQYIAAVNRAQEVIKNFPKTPAARKSLLTLQQAYKALGMNDLAASTQQLININ